MFYWTGLISVRDNEHHMCLSIQRHVYELLSKMLLKVKLLWSIALGLWVQFFYV